MIELQGINKIYQLGDERVTALDNVSLSIKDGEYISVMGPSGSGKSTLLNMLGLLDSPDGGQYVLDGVNTVELDEEARSTYRREHIGFVFQAYHLIPRLSAVENIELPMMLAGIPRAERRQRIEPLLESLGLASRQHHKPSQLSGGQRQRVAIARAVSMRPSVLLADEPTGNLDTASGADVVEVLETLNNQGITLIVVTHDVELGSRARRKVRMRDGAIIEDRTDS